MALSRSGTPPSDPPPMGMVAAACDWVFMSLQLGSIFKDLTAICRRAIMLHLPPSKFPSYPENMLSW